MNRLFAIQTLVVLGCVAAAGQSKPAFEVVSIKPLPGPTSETIRNRTFSPVYKIDASRLEIRSYPLFSLLTNAFRVQPPQVDAPEFVSNQYFEVLATFAAGTTKEQVPEMLQSMLAERFKLSYHRETREYKTTVVTVGKSGMKLTRLPDDTQPSNSRVRLADGTTRMTTVGSLSALFPVMGSFGGFPQMVDETGLDGMYTWVVDLPPGGGDASFQEVSHEAHKNTIEAAGLKLQIRKVAKETIVVDHIEKAPTEN